MHSFSKISIHIIMAISASLQLIGLLHVSTILGVGHVDLVLSSELKKNVNDHYLA